MNRDPVNYDAALVAGAFDALVDGVAGIGLRVSRQKNPAAVSR